MVHSERPGLRLRHAGAAAAIGEDAALVEPPALPHAPVGGEPPDAAHAPLGEYRGDAHAAIRTAAAINPRAAIRERAALPSPAAVRGGRRKKGAWHWPPNLRRALETG